MQHAALEAPEGTRPAPTQGARGGPARRGQSWLAASLPALALGAGAAGCSTSATGRPQLQLVSPEKLQAVGTQAFSQLKREAPRERDPATQRYVQCVARAIVRVPDVTTGPWEVVVFDDPTPNAFALPGGKIGVHSGLLRVARNAGQLAAVLGHEVAHVTQDHAGERASQTLLAESGLAIAGAASESEALLAALGLGTQVGVLLPFGRVQESEADVVGMHYMAEAGFDPREAIELWKNMRAAAGGGGPPTFLSTHPGDDDRIEDLEEKLPDALRTYRQSQRAPHCDAGPAVARASR